MIDAVKQIRTSNISETIESGLYNLCSKYESFCGLLYLKAIAVEYKWKFEADNEEKIANAIIGEEDNITK